MPASLRGQIPPERDLFRNVVRTVAKKLSNKAWNRDCKALLKLIFEPDYALYGIG